MNTKKTAAFDALLAQLTPEARAAMTRGRADPFAAPPPPDDPVDDAQAAYAALLSRLTPEARAAMTRGRAAPPPPPPPPKIAPNAARYCAVEAVDGEWAQLRVFKTAEAAARRLGEVEGRDMVVWVFYGVPCQFTVGPRRHLFLPDGTALPVPLYQGEGVTPVDAAALGDTAFETSGFVGPPELAVTPPAEAGVTAAVDDDD